MARETSKLGLNVWDLRTDKWKHSELAENWDTIDAEIWTGLNQIEILSAVPTTGNFAGRLVMLSATDQDFPAWGVVRYDGSNWRMVGTIEIQAFLPSTNNYAGRLIMLSQPYGGADAWSLHVYNGSAWVEMSRIGVQEENSTVGERPQINFLSGTGIDVSVTENATENRTEVTFASSAESEVTVRKDGNTIGTRKGIDFRDSGNVIISVADDPNTSTVELTFDADIASTSTEQVPKLLDYVEYVPGSVTTKTLNFVPYDQQTGSPAQSPLDNFYYQYEWLQAHRSRLDKLTRMGPQWTNQYGTKVAALDSLYNIDFFSSYQPTQATAFNGLRHSTLWTDIDNSLATTFTVPDSGRVSIFLSAIVNVTASSPRSSKYSTGGDYGAIRYTVYVPGTGGQPGHTVTTQSYDQVAYTVNQIIQQQGSYVGASSVEQAVQNGMNTTATGNNPVTVGGGSIANHTDLYIRKYTNLSGQRATSIPLYQDLSDAQIQWGLKDGDFLISGSEVCADTCGVDGSGKGFRTTVQVIFTDLQPGASKTWKWVWRIYNPYERASVNGTVLAGGDLGPASIEVWSLA